MTFRNFTIADFRLMYYILKLHHTGKQNKRQQNITKKKSVKCKTDDNDEGCKKRQYHQLSSVFPHEVESIDLRPYYDPHWNTHHGREPLHHRGGFHVPGMGGHGTYSGPQYTPMAPIELSGESMQGNHLEIFKIFSVMDFFEPIFSPKPVFSGLTIYFPYNV